MLYHKISKSAFLYALIVFSGCSNSKNIKESAIEIKSRDTLSIGGIVFDVDSLSIAEFQTIQFTPVHDTDESKYLKGDSLVTRNKNVLFFKHANGSTARLTSKFDEESTELYWYRGYLDCIGYWFTEGHYYEGYSYALVSRSRGDTAYLSGIPEVSPDCSYVITANEDQEAYYTFNGFELFKVKTSELISLGKREIKGWGPVSVKWLDNRTLLVKKAVLDLSGPVNKDTYSYLRLRMH